MDSSVTHETALRALLRLPPEVLESSARETGAIRRERKVRDSLTLLLMLLSYVVSDYSFKDTAALSGCGRFPSLCASSLHARFSASGAWLGWLLSYVLSGYSGAPPPGSRWLRLGDATVVNGPGETGIGWRVHALADAASGRIVAVRVEDGAVGESASLHPAGPESLITLDRCYSRAPGIHALVAAAGGFVIRVSPCVVMVCDDEKRRINPSRLARKVPREGAFGMRVRIPLRPRGRKCAGWQFTKNVAFVSVRLVGVRTRTGEVMWLFADEKSALSDADIAAIYRFRWQIELLFKRLKSLAHLDALKSRKGASARAWILAKLLFAALAQGLVRPGGPDKCGPGEENRHSAWSRFRAACDAVRLLVLGERILLLTSSEERLRRLVNTPRKRRQQPAPSTIPFR